MDLSIKDFDIKSDFITSPEELDNILSIPCVDWFLNDFLEDFHREYVCWGDGVYAADFRKFKICGSDLIFTINILVDGNSNGAVARITINLCKDEDDENGCS